MMQPSADDGTDRAVCAPRRQRQLPPEVAPSRRYALKGVRAKRGAVYRSRSVIGTDVAVGGQVRLGAVQRPLTAAWYCSMTLAGIRPRALTAMPWSFAHARSPLRCRPAAARGARNQPLGT